NAVKLYLHIGGNTPKAKWVVSEKLSSYGFIKMLKIDGEEEYDEDELGRGEGFWKVGRKFRARFSTDLQMKFFGDQRRVDFVDCGVWALKFDPSHFPGSLRTQLDPTAFDFQLYNWLSNSPSEMESYIRPGCIVLSLYLSMPSSAWDQLFTSQGSKDGHEFLPSLPTTITVRSIDVDFWGNGRFLAYTYRQMVVL
ncbi:squamosa promoter binding protein-like 14, partial [Striga asiatica]